MAVHYRFQEQKTTEAASILLQLQKGRMPYMKLLKLLYLADRLAILEWERPITYDSYVSMDYGPVLSKTFDLIKGNDPQSFYWNEHIAHNTRYDVCLIGAPIIIKKLSRVEIELLVKVNQQYGMFDQFELSRLTHALPEFKDPKGTSIPITIEDILAGNGYSTREIERIEFEIEEEADVIDIFGG